MRVAAWRALFPGPASRPGRRPLIHATTSITPLLLGRGRARHAAAPIGEGHDMRNIIRIGAGTDGRNRFVAIALGVALAVEPVMFRLLAQFPLPDLVVVGVQPLVGPDLPVEASQPADAGHDGAVRTCQRMVDDDLAAGRPLVGDGEPGSVAQRLVFAHEPPALLVPFAHVQRERPVLMLLVHDRLLFRNPKARCPGRAWWPRRFCVQSTMPRRSSAAPACVVRRTRHDPRYARGGQARRPG